MAVTGRYRPPSVAVTPPGSGVCSIRAYFSSPLPTPFGGGRVGGQQGPVQTGAQLSGGLGGGPAQHLGFDRMSQLRLLPGQPSQQHQRLGHVDLPGGQGRERPGQVSHLGGPAGQQLRGPPGQGECRGDLVGAGVSGQAVAHPIRLCLGSPPRSQLRHRGQLPGLRR